MSRIMAIDYGTKRCGIAVTDPTRTIATALDTIPSREIIEFLRKYFQKEIVETVVIGDPRHLNNQPSEISKLADQFVKKLIKEFPLLSIHRYDERFTSSMAAKSMIESGQSKKIRRDKAMLDQISATILLQNYLTSLSNL